MSVVEEFWVEIEDRPDRAVVHAVGELDLATVPKLSRVVEAAAQRRDVVVVVLERVWFIDVSAMGRLLRTRDHLTARGARLALTRAARDVHRSLELAQLDRQFLFLQAPEDPLVD